MVAEPFRPHPLNTDLEDEAILPLIRELNTVYGADLISKPVLVRVKPRAQMRRYRKPRPTDTKPEDGRAFGYWWRRPRIIDLASELLGRPVELRKVGAHESIHARAEDFEAWHWDQLLPELDPEPEGRFDQTIGDDDLGYPATPEECIATHGSAAIFGFWPPAFVTLYKRRFDRAAFPRIRAILLAQAPMQETLNALQRRVVALTRELAEANAALEQARIDRDGLLSEKLAVDNRLTRKDAAIDAARAV